jgi:hypothetical protein
MFLGVRRDKTLKYPNADINLLYRFVSLTTFLDQLGHNPLAINSEE